jgi:N-acetylglutamate synthase
MIQTIEERSMNAWPALQTIFYDGWVLRFANGYTRRANSITALYPGQQEPAEKIAECARLYHAQGLPAIYKLNGVEESRALDAMLAERGYRHEASTSVQTLDLREATFKLDPAICQESAPADRWEQAFSRLSGLAVDRQKTHSQMLGRILPAKCFVSLQDGGQVQACGLGVLQAGTLGVFDIVVDTACRRQGLGERIMRGLLAWAQQNGAHSAYLQVMKNNPPALSLYAKLGFREIYPYWYRVEPAQ